MAAGPPLGVAHHDLRAVVNYCSGELSPDASEAFERHAAACLACARLVVRARRVLAAASLTVAQAEEGGQEDAAEVHEPTRAPVRGQLLALPTHERPRQPSSRFWLPLLGVLLLALVVGAVQAFFVVVVPRRNRTPGDTAGAFDRAPDAPRR